METYAGFIRTAPNLVNRSTLNGIRPLGGSSGQCAAPLIAMDNFAPDRLLSGILEGKATKEYRRHKVLYLEGDPAVALYFVRNGVVAFTRASPEGRDVILGLAGPGQFFGEECLFQQTLRRTTAKALTDCQLIRVDKGAMLARLRDRPDYYAILFASLVKRTAQLETRLRNHLLYRGEKRLACALLSLARVSALGKNVIPKLSQETLGQLAGMTRPRACAAIGKFRQQGFLVWDRNEIEVRDSLNSVFENT